jgi:hypothetical protein
VLRLFNDFHNNHINYISLLSIFENSDLDKESLNKQGLRLDGLLFWTPIAIGGDEALPHHLYNSTQDFQRLK